MAGKRRGGKCLRDVKVEDAVVVAAAALMGGSCGCFGDRADCAKMTFWWVVHVVDEVVFARSLARCLID